MHIVNTLLFSSLISTSAIQTLLTTTPAISSTTTKTTTTLSETPSTSTGSPDPSRTTQGIEINTSLVNTRSSKTYRGLVNTQNLRTYSVFHETTAISNSAKSYTNSAPVTSDSILTLNGSNETNSFSTFEATKVKTLETSVSDKENLQTTTYYMSGSGSKPQSKSFISSLISTEKQYNMNRLDIPTELVETPEENYSYR